MKHRLVKKLKYEIRILKAKIKELEKRKPSYSNPMAALIDRPVNIDDLHEHSRRNKYSS